MFRHKCEYCGKLFSQKNNCVRHERIHTNEKPYECKICLTRFILKKNMIDHMRVHTGEKPFQCDICSEKFNRRSSMVRHARTHTNLKPFVCHHCGKAFAWKAYLLRHSLRSHSKNREPELIPEFVGGDLQKISENNLKGNIGDENGCCKKCKNFALSKPGQTMFCQFSNMKMDVFPEKKIEPAQQAIIQSQLTSANHLSRNKHVEIIIPKKNSGKELCPEEKYMFRMTRKEFVNFCSKRLVVRVTKYVPKTDHKNE